MTPTLMEKSASVGVRLERRKKVSFVSGDKRIIFVASHQARDATPTKKEDPASGEARS